MVINEHPGCWTKTVSRMLKFIVTNWRMVKIGTTASQRKLFFALAREKNKLVARGINHSTGLLAEHLGEDEGIIIEMAHRLGASELSLDYAVVRSPKVEI